VALWAATQLINKHPKESKTVLEKLVQEDGMVALAAEGVLDLWGNGM
jgi:hypothetical protein